MSVPVALALLIFLLLALFGCKVEAPRDAGGNGVQYSAPDAENPTSISAPDGGHVPPGHGGPNPGQGPGGGGPPGQNKDKGKDK